MSSRNGTPLVRAPGAAAPVLNASLLGRIRELNLDYLDLLASGRSVRSAQGAFELLSESLVAAIAGLTREARFALASTPYTLYSLGFEDRSFWRFASEAAEAQVVERYAGPCESPYEAFCEAALLFAWHVASSNPLAGRMLFAMGEAAALQLAEAPFWRLRRLAAEHARLLTPRWPTNPAFWPDLVRFAAAKDERRLRTTQLLGCQLIAAELECATDRRHAQYGSPRLRARAARFARQPLR